MLSEMKKAVMFGVRLSRMSKSDAERQMQKVMAVSKVGARHAKAFAKKAHAAAMKEKRKLESEVRSELKKQQKVASKRKSAKRPATKKTAKKRQR